MILPPNRLNNPGNYAGKDVVGNFRSLSPTSCQVCKDSDTAAPGYLESLDIHGKLRVEKEEAVTRVFPQAPRFLDTSSFVLCHH